MFRLRALRVSTILLLTLFLTLIAAAQDTADGVLLRFVHAIPGASPIDVYVNDQLTVANLNFAEATEYISAPAAELRIVATQAGVTTPLWQQTAAPGAGRAYTLVVSSFFEPVAFTLFEDILDPLPLGKARFTAIHAIPETEPVDVLLADGRPVLLQVAYNQPAGTLDVPVFPYSMVVVPSGGSVEDALVTIDSLALNSGTSYMLLVYGTSAIPQTMLLSAPTQAEQTDGGFLRLVHGVPGAPAVDVYINDTLTATLSEPAGGFNASRYISVPAGDYTVSLRASGTEQNLLSTDLTVNDGDRLTAVASGSADSLSLNVFTDDLSGISSDQALVRVINAGAGDEAVSASLEDGTALAEGVAAGETSNLAAITPVTSSVTVKAGEVEVTSLAINFYGGAFYDVLVVPGDESVVTILPPAAIAQTLASAPGAGTAVIAVQPTASPTIAETPTLAAPIEVTPTATTEAAPAGEQPAQPSVPTQPPAATPIPFTGRVFNLNPNANLQLRQYPNSQALSLGTVPSGTELIVNGREGELADIPLSATRIPPDYEYIDPVGLLVDEDSDLVREETWLNVIYNTPDGGQIEAWVRSDYVDVRNARGEQMRLRDLPTVPGNTPGESRDTAITSPSARQDVATAVVVNLNPGTNLNLRRTPDTTGEVLAQIPLGGVAEFIGISEGGLWAFLSYTGPDGSSATGWANTEFLDYLLNGAPTTEEILEREGLFQVIPLDRRGELIAGSAVVAAPTEGFARDTIVAVVELNPGANLNLRRTPTVNAEVLAQIPSGTRVPVMARTGDGFWLNVTYEGIDGWIAARTDTAVFVRLTRNDVPFELLDVPLAEGEIDSARFTPTPTIVAPPATPTPTEGS